MPHKGARNRRHQVTQTEPFPGSRDQPVASARPPSSCRLPPPPPPPPLSLPLPCCSFVRVTPRFPVARAGSAAINDVCDSEGDGDCLCHQQKRDASHDIPSAACSRTVIQCRPLAKGVARSRAIGIRYIWLFRALDDFSPGFMLRRRKIRGRLSQATNTPPCNALQVDHAV